MSSAEVGAAAGGGGETLLRQGAEAVSLGGAGGCCCASRVGGGSHRSLELASAPMPAEGGWRTGICADSAGRRGERHVSPTAAAASVGRFCTSLPARRHWPVHSPPSTSSTCLLLSSCPPFPSFSQRLLVSTFLGRPCIIKERFAKKYRHPDLDKRLTQQRIVQVGWDCPRILNISPPSAPHPRPPRPLAGGSGHGALPRGRRAGAGAV